MTDAMHDEEGQSSHGEERQPRPRDEASPPRREEASQPQGVVLIVDDDKPIADFVAAVVAEAGYTPVVATRGAQALELARAHWPVLVITDLMLPFMSGATLIAELRAAAEAAGHPAPPAVLMTAAGPRHAQAAGAQAILPKPFDLTALETMLERLLGERLPAWERAAPYGQSGPGAG